MQKMLSSHARSFSHTLNFRQRQRPCHAAIPCLCMPIPPLPLGIGIRSSFSTPDSQSQRMCACELSAQIPLSFVSSSSSYLFFLVSRSNCLTRSIRILRKTEQSICVRGRTTLFSFPPYFISFQGSHTLSYEIPRDLDNFILPRLFLPSFSLLVMTHPSLSLLLV